MSIVPQLQVVLNQTAVTSSCTLSSSIKTSFTTPISVAATTSICTNSYAAIPSVSYSTVGNMDNYEQLSNDENFPQPTKRQIFNHNTSNKISLE